MIHVVQCLLCKILVKIGTAERYAQLLVRHFGEDQQMTQVGQKALIVAGRFFILPALGKLRHCVMVKEQFQFFDGNFQFFSCGFAQFLNIG
ncbi:hypothetical protein D3C71_1772860 [compost metagenome]